MTKYQFGRPKKRIINQDKIAVFLRKIGFEAESIVQEWRHLLAFGKFQGKEAVFKLASTQATAPLTQNEFNWNEAVHLVPEKQHPNFTVPENYSSGYYGKLFYFIAERFMEEPLVSRNSPDLSRATPKIGQIAKMTREIETLSVPSDCAFAQGKKPRKNEPQIPIGHKLLKPTIEWASRIPRDLNKFVAIVEAAKDNLRTASAHGDYVVRQMYQVKDKIGIIDGEHAGNQGPLHYDVAQFYLRLRNDHDGKELAAEYLKKFQNLLLADDSNIFWEELKPVLIQRYIGDLWGASKNEVKLKQLEPLGKEILNDKII